jgi:hypothetical protein
MGPIEFQDRCLKPLGHPSVDNIEYLRIAAGTTNVNVAAEASVVPYFQERMPYGLFVPDVP